MDILQTHQLSTAIIDIINESEQYCYIVTPYIKLWPLLERTLDKAKKKEKRITIVMRYDAKGNPQLAQNIHAKYGFEVIALDKMHTKLYLSENQALVTSMNLYDTSKENNHEIGILFDKSSLSETLLKEYVINDLLQVKPKLHLQGYFFRKDCALASQMMEFEAKLDKMGFCVVCGDSIDVEKYPKSYAPYYRCKKCYYENPNVDSYALETKYCHLCGNTFQSTLSSPIHKECRESIENYVGWDKQGRRGSGASV